MTSDLSRFTLSGLGGDDEEPTARVVLGGRDNGGPRGHVQKAGVYDEHVGFDDAFDRHAGSQAKAGRYVEDTEWEEYQRLKAEATARGVNDPNFRQSNMPVGKPGTVRVIVDEAPDMPPTGYPVGLNGRCYIIRPGEPVDLPLAVLEIIKNAVISKPQLDKNTKQVIGYRDAPRIPWRYAA